VTLADESGLVCAGGDLDPGTLLAAYRHGLFPMPLHNTIGWWSPDPRGILPLEGLKVSRSLRRSLARYEVRIDTAFADVVAACADPSRPDGWISQEIQAAYTRLHQMGWAHSVESWHDGTLVGGLYGVAIGGLFAGESMFHHRTDASKVALVHLVDGLAATGGSLLDVQWRTPHLARLGVVEISREEYLRRLRDALRSPLAGPWVEREGSTP
jgi:leucyl/phenylalanyl-tRNA--protein transferase